MKKISIVFVVLIFLLSGCGNSNKDSEELERLKQEYAVLQEEIDNLREQAQNQQENIQLETTETTLPQTTTTAEPPHMSAVFIEDGTPYVIGDNFATAKLLNTSIVESATYGWLMIFDIEFTNNSDDARNLINYTYCKMIPFQDGIELDRPGVTSEQGVYDYTDAYTQIKKGATITTQFVWKLRNNTSPVEIEFGRAEDYGPVFIKTLYIVEPGQEDTVVQVMAESGATVTACDAAINLTVSDLDKEVTQSGTSYYYRNVIIHKDDMVSNGGINQGAMYRSIAKYLAGFTMGLNNGSAYAELLTGQPYSTHDEFAVYAANASEFIRMEDDLYHILKKFESLKAVEGEFDFPGDTFNFSITDLSACADEMMISEEMLGYILANLSEFAFEITFLDNGCTLNYDALFDFG